MLASVMIDKLVQGMVDRKGDFEVEPDFCRAPERYTIKTMGVKEDTVRRAYQEGKKYGTFPDSSIEHLPPQYKSDSEEGIAWKQGYQESFHGVDPEKEAF